MKRADFVKVAEEILGSLPEEVCIQNVAILVEDFPPHHQPLASDSKGGGF